MKKLLQLFFKVWGLFTTLYAGYGFKLFLVAALGIFSGFVEGFGITLLVPVFAFLVGTSSFGSNFFIKFLEKISASTGITFGFETLLIIIGTLFIVKAALLLIYWRIQTRVSADYRRSIRRKIYERLLGSSFSFLQKQKLGHVDYVLLADVDASTRMLESTIHVILDVTTLMTYAAVSFALSPAVTLTAFGTGLVILFVLKPFDRILRRYSRAIAASVKDIAHSVSETITGIKTVKAFGAEQPVLEDMSQLFKEHEYIEVKKQDIKTFIKVSIEPLSILFILAMFSITYKFLTFELASFVPIMYLVQQMFLRVEKIQNAKNLLSGAFPHAQSIQKTLAEITIHTPRIAGGAPYAFMDAIRFENVSFRYGTNEIIHGLTLEIRRGKTIGIIGPSGAGKTTLVDLLLRFIEPSAGRIAIDGRAISDIDFEEWRKKVMYVAQDVFLRNTSVLENIRFYDAALPHGAIVEAAKMANIYDFIRSLPHGFDTVVGERGTRLSGGERQRIALARALARAPSVLVLDEATSALDAESEAMIKEALRRLKGEITILIIAHRMSTVMDVDEIYVIDKGILREHGVPEELLLDPHSYFSKISRLGTV